jgi:hypothetical protein
MFLCNDKLLLFWLVPDSQLTLQKTDMASSSTGAARPAEEKKKAPIPMDS